MHAQKIPLGPIMLDLLGTTLTQDEKELLLHPLVGGVIFFTRNYESPKQITALSKEIRMLRDPSLCIAVDHEGGRVQRFQQGFTKLPAAQTIGKLYDQDPYKGIDIAEKTAWLMATELRTIGIDFSFAPVLDLYNPNSHVIGDRAFHTTPKSVAKLTTAYLNGMRHAGMAAVGKHFPGHGGVTEDSHLVTPTDNRTLAELQKHDMIPFSHLIHRNIAAIMPAHIIYPEIDNKPVGFSAIWLQNILRKNMKFQGIIFSDDINMVGAESIGNYVERARCALLAGCNIVIICNNQLAAITVLDTLKINTNMSPPWDAMCSDNKPYNDLAHLQSTDLWKSVTKEITKININK